MVRILLLLLIGHIGQVVYNSSDIIALGIFDNFLYIIFIIHPIPVGLFLAVNRGDHDKAFEGRLLVGLLHGTQSVVSVLDIKEDDIFSDIHSKC